MSSRKEKADVFVRVCRDSGFRLEAIQAAKIAASLLKCHPIEIASAMGSVDIMSQVACGNHPAAHKTTSLHTKNTPTPTRKG